MPDTQFFTDHNARHVFHPMGHPAEIQSNPPRIICKGEGVFIEDEQGKTLCALSTCNKETRAALTGKKKTEQAAYIGVEVEGPYKVDHYRY